MQTLDRLLAAAVCVADDMDADLRRRGLTRARATALWQIARHGPLTQRKLADLLAVTPRNVTKLVDALEAAGLVRRTPSPRDRRALLVDLTEQGRSDSAALRAEAGELADALFGGLSPTERAAFGRVLDQVVVHFGGPPSGQERQD
ncbi:hypothetical protein GCM10027440_06520 [Nocardiopsis coralliicola]